MSDWVANPNAKTWFDILTILSQHDGPMYSSEIKQRLIVQTVSLFLPRMAEAGVIKATDSFGRMSYAITNAGCKQLAAGPQPYDSTLVAKAREARQ